MEYQEGMENIGIDAVLRLYKSVGWTEYTKDPDGLKTALEHSSYIVSCVSDGKLVGLARSISDDISIHYLQDILVDPDFHRKGIGRKLLEKCLLRFKRVRTHMILTDNEEKQKVFYESLGFRNTRTLIKTPLNAYVRMKDIDLK